MSTFECYGREFPVGLSPSALREHAEIISQSKRIDLVEVESELKQAQTTAATKLNDDKRKQNGHRHSFSLC